MKKFIIDTLERCLYTFAEAMLGFITIGSTITQIDWLTALSVSVVASIVCALKQVCVRFKYED